MATRIHINQCCLNTTLCRWPPCHSYSQNGNDVLAMVVNYTFTFKE